MARHKKRHHRKVQQRRFGDVPQQAIEVKAEDTSVQLSPALTMVRNDLTKTAITSIILIAVLIVVSILNTKYHWTLSVGSELYRLLHIR